jgi:hypothetical protein
MMTMCGLGVGEIIGGIGMGIIVDKIGAKKSCFVNMFLILLQTLLVCAYIAIDTYGYLAYIMTIAWGMQDSSISIHLDAILGFEFTSNKEPFAIGIRYIKNNYLGFHNKDIFEIFTFLLTLTYRCVIGVTSCVCVLNSEFCNECQK